MAKFRVVTDTGVQIPHVGFYRLGDEYAAPSPDYIPPRNAVVPLDDEAALMLLKAKEQYVAILEARYAEMEPPRKLTKAQKAELLRVPEVPKAEAQKPVQGDGDQMTPRQFTERQLGQQRAESGAAKPSGRAADS